MRCERCESPEDRRYTEAVEALLNSGTVDSLKVRAFFEYVDGEITEDEMYYLVGNDGQSGELMRSETRQRYGYVDL